MTGGGAPHRPNSLDLGSARCRPNICGRVTASAVAGSATVPSPSLQEKRLEKQSVQMTVDQRGAIMLFESQAEALLRDHVRGVDGKTHDIVVLGHNVAQVRAQMEG